MWPSATFSFSFIASSWWLPLCTWPLGSLELRFVWSETEPYSNEYEEIVRRKREQRSVKLRTGKGVVNPSNHLFKPGEGSECALLTQTSVTSCTLSKSKSEKFKRKEWSKMWSFGASFVQNAILRRRGSLRGHISLLWASNKHHLHYQSNENHVLDEYTAIEKISFIKPQSLHSFGWERMMIWTFVFFLKVLSGKLWKALIRQTDGVERM